MCRPVLLGENVFLWNDFTRTFNASMLQRSTAQHSCGRTLSSGSTALLWLTLIVRFHSALLLWVSIWLVSDLEYYKTHWNNGLQLFDLWAQDTHSFWSPQGWSNSIWKRVRCPGLVGPALRDLTILARVLYGSPVMKVLWIKLKVPALGSYFEYWRMYAQSMYGRTEWSIVGPILK